MPGTAQPAEVLDEEKLAMLRKAFIMFDQGKTGKIEKEKIRTILNTLGANYINEELETLLADNDVEGTGKLDFDAFAKVVGHFLEEQDEEAMQKELKEAFRLYDKEGQGFIPTSALKEILGALDDKLTSADLDNIVDEIDEDGSGTVDFDEFMEMMTGD
ncbi:troponin C-like isoform X1 [Macrobrachium rosenbergii]|uniref:troponin C-like isoform X1 n=1 Tax=Macrobrachium nipponense TaxID=159736 RepID=UPI0010AFE84B